MELRAARLVKQGGEKKDGAAHPPSGAGAEERWRRRRADRATLSVYDTIRYYTILYKI